jgi:ketosteroid isomerase-like protein
MARTLRRGYAATSRGDYELSLIGYDPDVELHMTDSAMVSDDLVGVHRGHDGWRHLVGALVEVWDFKWQPEEAIDCGDQILVSLRLETRGRGSGIPITHRTFDVITWRNGLVIRQEVFGKREQALEAVGLRE